MRIVESRRVEGLAELHLARAQDDPRRLIEFVDTLEPGVPKREKWVLMVSTQAGCPIGCALCDAGAIGYWGSLTADEMLGQVRAVLDRNPELDPASHPKLKIHFARMGEPTLNPAVLEALVRLPALVPGRGLLPSLSTVAPAAPGAERFLKALKPLKDELYPDGRFQLQFSLHASDEDSRRRIIPVRTWEYRRIAEYGRWFRGPGCRKVTLNFAPPPDAELSAEKVAAVFDPETFLVKVTPVNPTATAEARGTAHPWDTAPEPVVRFGSELRELGFEVIVSPSLPEEVESATSCGQLWSSLLRGQAETRRRSLSRDERSYLASGALEAKSRLWAAELSRFARPPAALDRPALLVIDMQEFFLDPRSPAYLPPARAVAENVARLARAFREAGRPVAFTTHAYADDAEAGPMGAWWKHRCRAGEPEARLAEFLRRRPDEPVFRKTRYDAFTSPLLGPWLESVRARALAICGVQTHLCVESTARRAFELGYDVRLPLDACAAKEEEFHLSSLKSAAHGFAAVGTAEDLISRLCLEAI